MSQTGHSILLKHRKISIRYKTKKTETVSSESEVTLWVCDTKASRCSVCRRGRRNITHWMLAPITDSKFYTTTLSLACFLYSLFPPTLAIRCTTTKSVYYIQKEILLDSRKEKLHTSKK